MKKFRDWLMQEHRDIFGFEKEVEKEKAIQNDKPFKHFDSDLLIKELLQTTIGIKEPRQTYSDTIIWGGTDVESMHLDISPLGSFKVVIRKIMKNLQGENVWICKKVLPLPDDEVRENAGRAYDLIVEGLKEIDNKIDSPAPKYDLEKLTIKLAEDIKAERPCKIMFLDRVIRNSDNNFLITMDVAAGGVEGPSSTRIEQFHIQMHFDKTTGLIRSIGSEVISPTRQRLWYPAPAEWDENFAPTQPIKEITRIIMNTYSTY